MHTLLLRIRTGFPKVDHMDFWGNNQERGQLGVGVSSKGATRDHKAIT